MDGVSGDVGYCAVVLRLVRPVCVVVLERGIGVIAAAAAGVIEVLKVYCVIMVVVWLCDCCCWSFVGVVNVGAEGVIMLDAVTSDIVVVGILFLLRGGNTMRGMVTSSARNVGAFG
jgi:hypothetical protein